jgi:gamma-glutamylcyclotransferase (GGCT)/AIG2-like uncharacterized protein YtfP
MKFLVFVYGTLMQGEHNDHCRRSAEFRGKARTRPEFTLISMDFYPALVKVGSTSVEGELYLVDEDVLRYLDYLERHPKFYRREIITMDDGEEAYAYLLPVIQSGNWRDEVRERKREREQS